MPPELVIYITKYGYIAIFSLVFLQEIGVPNPIPNELVLLFCGYLTSTGVLSFPLVFLTVVAADFIGTSLLYSAFYFFGSFILSRKFRWMPVFREKIEKFSERIANQGRWEIYLGRLIPYVRGYTSVAAGFLQVKPRVFLTAVLVSAITWSGGYVTAGNILSSYWDEFMGDAGSIGTISLIIAAVLAFILLGRWFGRRCQKEKKN